MRRSAPLSICSAARLLGAPLVLALSHHACSAGEGSADAPSAAVAASAVAASAQVAPADRASLAPAAQSQPRQKGEPYVFLEGIVPDLVVQEGGFFLSKDGYLARIAGDELETLPLPPSARDERDDDDVARLAQGTLRVRGDELVVLAGGAWVKLVGPEPFAAAVLPWMHGRSIVPTFSSDSKVPTFAVLGEPGVAPPDFSGIQRHGWESTRRYAPSHDGFEPKYATLPSGEIMLVDQAIGPSHADAPQGVFQWSPRGGARFDPLPMPHAFGAFFPIAIAAKSARDVYVGAAIVTKPFDENFPGCPSIVRQELDGAYLAHFDGTRWTHVPFPGVGRLASMTLREDGSLEVVSGWNRGEVPFRAASWKAQERWRRSPSGAWEKIESGLAARALAAGWKIENDEVLRRDASGAWRTFELPSLESGDKRTPIAIAVVAENDVWIDTETTSPPIHDGEYVDHARPTGTRAWIRTGGPGVTWRYIFPGDGGPGVVVP